MAGLGDEPATAPRARAEWDHFDGFATRPSRMGRTIRRSLLAVTLIGLAVAGLLALVG